MTTDPLPVTRLWTRSFGAYLASLAGAALSDALLFVALPFLVLGLGGDARTLGTVAMLGALPRFLGPVIGTLADRWPLKLPLAASGLLRMALAGLVGGLALSGGLQLWMLYLLAPLNAVLALFVFAAGNVLVPLIVPKAKLPRANSLLQAAMMGLPLVGFGLAGALIGALGAAQTVLMAAPGFVLLPLATLLIRFPPTERGAQANTMLQDILEAARFLRRAGPLAFIVVTSLLLNASLSLLNVVMPVLMERGGHGAQGYGLFEAVVSGGTLLGILAVSVVANRVRPQFQISLAQALMASGFAVLALGAFHWLLGGGALLGFGLGFTEVAAITLLQLAVPDGMRGKVLGLVFSANAVGLSAGAYLSGELLARLPTSVIFVIGAAVIAAACLFWTAINLAQRERLERLMAAS